MRSLRCAIIVAIVGACAASFAAASQAPATETAAQFYLRWRNAALNAKSIDEITRFWDAETLEQFNMEPASAKADTLPMMKRLYGMQTGVKVTKETPTPNGATLSLEALGPDQTPVVTSVDVVKEHGAWKVTGAVERWTPKRL